LQLDAKAYDDALKTVSGSFPSEFEALVADRKGDIFLAQGKKAEAIAEYQKSFKGLSDRLDYRRLVEVKLTALGVDASASSAAAAPAAGDKK
jgi:predicted negative regulator of RcsB-dependent stress response